MKFLKTLKKIVMPLVLATVMLVSFSTNALAAVSIVRDYSYTPVVYEDSIVGFGAGFYTDRIFNDSLGAGGFKIAKAHFNVWINNNQYAIKAVKLTFTEYGYTMTNAGAVGTSYNTQYRYHTQTAPSSAEYVVYVANSLWTYWHFKGYDRMKLVVEYYHKQDPTNVLTITKTVSHTTPNYGY